MEPLLLDSLPDLPQFSTLPTALRRVWEQEAVIALWLGGSVACGKADAYSDLDLWLCVSADWMASYQSALAWNTR